MSTCDLLHQATERRARFGTASGALLGALFCAGGIIVYSGGADAVQAAAIVAGGLLGAVLGCPFGTVSGCAMGLITRALFYSPSNVGWFRCSVGVASLAPVGLIGILLLREVAATAKPPEPAVVVFTLLVAAAACAASRRFAAWYLHKGRPDPSETTR